jgi:fumarylacetoacetate (FAA) hydrolase
MKFVSFLDTESNNERFGALLDDSVLDLQTAAEAYTALAAPVSPRNPMMLSSALAFLRGGNDAMALAQEVVQWAEHHRDEVQMLRPLDQTTLLAPVPHPTSMRDGYAFRQHVEAARRNRGVEMIPEFDQFPIFYFTNHNAVTGPGTVDVMERHLEKLDFELEAAIVIGKEGRNISASEADEYIAGYMVMNDWSARALQMEEMKLNLGPAKGKDFATSIGPWMATRDELEPKRIAGDQGERFDLTMITRVNGTEVSRGNLKDMTWTFAQIIERASYGVTLYPGDVIGSGTVGTGCFLELNGSKITDNWWLKDGDTVECEIEMLGTLTNTIRKVG